MFNTAHHLVNYRFISGLNSPTKMRICYSGCDFITYMYESYNPPNDQNVLYYRLQYLIYQTITASWFLQVVITALWIITEQDDDHFARFDPFAYNLLFISGNRNLFLASSLAVLFGFMFYLNHFFVFTIMKICGRFFIDVYLLTIHRYISFEQCLSYIDMILKFKAHPFVTRRTRKKLFFTGIVCGFFTGMFTRCLVIMNLTFPVLFTYRYHDGHCWRSVLIFVNSFLFVFTSLNGIRFGVFIVAFQLSYMIIFTEPIRTFGRRSFRRITLKKSSTLVDKICRSLRIYIYHYREYVSFDKTAVRNFFTCFLATLFVFNVINSAAIITKRYDATVLNLVLPFLILTSLISVLSASNLIYTSDSLTCFSPKVASVIALLSVRRAKIGIVQWLKSSLLLETVHNNRPFRFKFGTLGRISRRSFVSFAVFYSIQIMTVTQHYSRSANEL